MVFIRSPIISLMCIHYIGIIILFIHITFMNTIYKEASKATFTRRFFFTTVTSFGFPIVIRKRNTEWKKILLGMAHRQLLMRDFTRAMEHNGNRHTSWLLSIYLKKTLPFSILSLFYVWILNVSVSELNAP